MIDVKEVSRAQVYLHEQVAEMNRLVEPDQHIGKVMLQPA